MVGVVELAAARVQDVPVYRPGRASPGPQAGKLSSNEAPLGPSPEIQAAITSSSGRVNRYPEPAQAVDALAHYAGTSPDRLLLTNGSDELCYLVATLFLGPGRVAVVGDPCYQIDATASLVSGALVRRVPLRGGPTTCRLWPKRRPGLRLFGCRPLITRPGWRATPRS